MEHLVQFAISVDDDRIRQTIEKNVEKKVVDTIVQEVKDRLVGRFDTKHPQNRYLLLEKLIIDRIDNILLEKQDVIIETASDKLAERLSRTKRVKNSVEKIIEDIL